jgi:hypothetical protein
MKHIRNTLGFFVAGIFVMGLWGGFAGAYGIGGGFAGAIIIIGPLWYLNHKLGLIHQQEEHAFVDMALGIGIAGLARDFFMNGGQSLVDAVPTLVFVIIGGIIGGVLSAYIEQDIEMDKEKANRGEQ